MKFKHLEEQENQENLSYDLASNSSTTRDRTKAIVRSVVGKLVSDVVDNVERASPAEDCVIVEDKPKAKSNRRGQNRRNKYTAQFKATVIEKMMPGVLQEHLVEEFNVSQSNISKWLKNKDKIFKETADSNRKTLTKMRVGTKYVRLYSELLTEVRKARSRGYLVNFNWIWTKARKIYRKQEDNPDANVRKHVVTTFLRRYNIRMRARQRNRKYSKEHFRVALTKWHGSTRYALFLDNLTAQ